MNELNLLKPYLSNFLHTYYNVSNTKRNFRCISHTHDDKHPSMSYNEKEHYVKCFSCGYTGNILSVASEYWGISKAETMKKLIDIYIPSYRRQSEENCQSPLEYLHKRGLADETIAYFNISFEDDFQATYTTKDGKTKHFSMGSVVKIPSDKDNSSYFIRSVSKKKFYKPSGSIEPLFFADELEQKEPVVVVESVFCAMIIHQIGGHAVALNGTGWQKLLSALNAKKNPPPIILSLDNDAAGQRAAEQLYDELIANEYKVVNYPLSAQAKDPNELYLEDKEKLKSEFEKAIHAVNNKDITEVSDSNLLLDYMAYSFLDDIKRKKEQVLERSSGFPILDKNLNGIGEGLYIFGGRPGVGKTTFLDQIAYNLAEKVPVLYFSYEQKKLHFAAKQISRLSYQLTNNPFQSRDLLSGNITKQTVDMIEHYLSEKRQIYIHSEQYDVETLMRKIEKFEDRYGVSPIIIIDFIQKIPVSNKTTTKDSIDYVVSTLEKFTHENHRTVILVSSFNRFGYYAPLSMDSFRETGNLEYAADVMLGIQYQVVSKNKVFLTEGKLAEKQMLIRNEDAKKIREVELCCLKNRYGTQFNIPFKYYTEYDCFTCSNQLTSTVNRI